MLTLNRAVRVIAIGSLLLARTAFYKPVMAQERVELESTETPRLVVQLGHSNLITSLAISSDGRFVVSGSLDNSARLWFSENGEELQRFDNEDLDVNAVSINSRGDTIITASGSDVILWAAHSGNKIRTLRGHSNRVRSAVINPQGTYILTCSEDKTVRLWSTKSGENLQTIVFSEPLIAVVMNQEASSFAVLSRAGAVWIGQLDIEDELYQLTEPGEQITSLSMTDDGQSVVTVNKTGEVRLWSMSERFLLDQFSGVSDGLSHHAAISPDGEFVFAASGREIFKWSTATGELVHRYQVIESRITALAVYDKGMAIGLDNGLIYLWPSSSRDETLSLTGLAPRVRNVAISENGEYLATANLDGSVTLWPLSDTSEPVRMKGHGSAVSSVAFSPDSKYLVSGSWDHSAVLWDVLTREEVLRFEGHDGWVTSVAISRDNKYLVTGSGDDTARIWDLQSGEFVSEITGHQDEVLSVDIHAYESVESIGIYDYLLTTGSSDESIGFWSMSQDGYVTLLDKIKGHSDSVFSLSLGSDGELLASASPDHSVLLWNARSLEPIGKYRKHDDWVSSVDISSDGEFLVSACGDGNAYLWSTGGEDVIRKFEGHTDGVRSVAFSPDDRLLITSSYDKTTRIWSVETGTELATLISFTDGNWAVVDKEGRFDSSNGGDIPGLHWVVGNTPIVLSQLKDRYYDPGLLTKVMGFNDEPLRGVDAFRKADVALAPEVTLTAPSIDNANLQVQLTNAGGGIGAVRILVNGKELLANARDPLSSPDQDSLLLSVPIANSSYLEQGKENEIVVIATNADSSITSPATRVFYTPPGPASTEIPSLWGIVMGVHDYVGDRLDLRYAAKDAADMAQALRVGATRFLGADKVSITLLSTDPEALAEGAREATKANLEAAFEEIGAQAKAGDILVVYLSGHGVTYADGREGEYYYLTKDAGSGNLSEAGYRKGAAVSGFELKELIKKVSATNKQILILDTCGSGRLVNETAEVGNTSAEKDTETDKILALERLKDRTGMFVLAGSAADAVSYEATPYGQGLLTYSLLEGMRNPEVLQNGSLVDVRSWFDYAERRVPELAHSLGGEQEPRQFGASSFAVAQITSADVSELPLLPQARPLFMKSRFVTMPFVLDPMQLSSQFDRALYEASSKGNGEVGYVGPEVLKNAYRFSGLYEIEDGIITVKVNIARGESEIVESLTAEGDVESLGSLIQEVINEAVSKIASVH